tara:strand:+ start:472 stop:1938 length:1467 start_codon:yes stop_codon:yes gene_type:complete
MGLLDNLNFSQPFSLSSLLPSEAQLQAFKDKSDAEALEQFSQDPNPIRRVPFNILTALGVNPTIAQAAPTTLDVAPVTGDISALADARTAFGQGDLATAGLLTAATLIPGVPAGKVKGLLKKSDDTKPLLNVDDAPKQGIEYIPPTDNEPGIIAFHGSPYDFDQFKIDKIGTGEGAQAFGYGLYFTDSEDIAKFYKNAGLKSQNVEYKGTPIKFFSDDRDEFDREAIIQGLVRDRILGGKFNTKESIDSVINQLEQTIENSYDLSQPLDRISQEGYDGLVQDLNYAKTLKADDFSYNAGKTYKVALAPNPDELLDYDKMLMDQPESMQRKVQEIVDILPFNKPPMDARNGNSFQAEITSQVEDSIKNLVNTKLMVMDGKMSEEVFDNIVKQEPFIDLVSKKLIRQGAENQGFGINPIAKAPQIASQIMNDYGIKGIKYKAGQGVGIRNIDETSKKMNYVIFDENLINVLAKYGIVGGVGITALQNSDI